jgi:hypothetical protein
MIEHCSVCGEALCHNPRRKTTMCKRHAIEAAARDPARRAKVSASAKAKHADPEYRAKRAPMYAIVARRTLAERPELREVYRETMRRNRRPGGSEPGTDERRRAKISELRTKLPDIPLEYREEYRRLSISDKIPKVDRVRMIQEQMQRDMKRYHETGELQASKGSTKR